MGRGDPELADHPANRVLVDYLRAQARRPGTPHDHTYSLDGWVLHTHPELLGRLSQIAPDDIPVIPLFGVPSLAFNGIAAVVALEPVGWWSDFRDRRTTSKPWVLYSRWLFMDGTRPAPGRVKSPPQRANAALPSW